MQIASKLGELSEEAGSGYRRWVIGVARLARQAFLYGSLREHPASDCKLSSSANHRTR